MPDPVPQPSGVTVADLLDAAEARAVKAEKALREIRDMDYRGNRHPSASIAELALGIPDA